MSHLYETLKLIADSTRLRMLRLLSKQQLSVVEIQEIMEMGQSRISSQLALLKQAELVLDRKEGKKSIYAFNTKIDSCSLEVIKIACKNAVSNDFKQKDNDSLKRVLLTRKKQTAHYFNTLAGKLGKNYCPGRSWQAISHLLVNVMPAWKVVDLGAGESFIAQMMAQQAESVTCIDNSPKMVEVGRALVKKNGFDNIDYQLGDIESLPLEGNGFDLALFSQALHHAENPELALKEAYRVLIPGGKLLILDLLQHSFYKAEELYADRWMGFSKQFIYELMQKVGFQNVCVDSVAREDIPPNFETLLVSGIK